MVQKKFITTRAHFERLRNDGHVALNRLFIEEVEEVGPSELGILALYGPYKALVAEEESVLDMIFGSRLTAKIEELDKERDHLYRGIADVVKGDLNHYDPAKRAAAVEVELVLKHYGDVTRRPINEQTAVVYDVIRELNAPANLPLVTLLELPAWLTALEKVNRELELAMAERFAELSKRPEQRMQVIRKEVDKQLRAILDKIEAMGRTGSPFFNPAFVKEVNALMTYYKDLQAQESGRRHPVKDISVADHLVVEPIETQPYTGKAITPIPRAHFREAGKPTVELVFAQDFTVTYKNNVEVGMARLVLHGTGNYKGQMDVTFNIARQTLRCQLRITGAGRALPQLRITRRRALPGAFHLELTPWTPRDPKGRI
jgi:hypothetical protein